MARNRLIEQIKTYRYELVALITGASVMMLEIVGARLIAPYFGTSTYVWTAMIGVILGSLALGYWYGGRIADTKDSSRHLGALLVIAAALLLMVALVHPALLQSIAETNLDLRLSAFIAAVLLFGVPSALIGAISPHLAKVRVTSLDITGKAVGRLEAAGAIGSISGTFLAGYVLLGWLGSRSIMLGLVAVLVVVSFLVDYRRWRAARVVLAMVALVCIWLPPIQPVAIISDTDSAYARYQVKSVVYNGRATTILQTDHSGYQSGVYDTAAPGELPFAYTRDFMKLFGEIRPASVLMIGGGTYVVPGAIAEIAPSTAVTVVEIDPQLDQLAARYFGYNSPPSVEIVHEDGRTFLNRNQQQFPLAYVDAFQALTPPFQLTTKEAVAGLKRAVGDQGLVVVNVIAESKNGRSEYLEALQATYQTQFEAVAVVQTNPRLSPAARQNFLMLVANDPQVVERAKAALGQRPTIPVTAGGRILSDDYAPIERLTFH